MTDLVQKSEPASATLCKACGSCCTGHLFTHASFKPSEVETTRALGLQVLQTNPDKPHFLLPCPLWEGHCTIYTHPNKPSICGNFKCKLLREMQDDSIPLAEALSVVQRAKQLIQELERQLPDGQHSNFRRRLFEYVDQLQRAASPTESENAFRLKAGVLLVLFAQRFGVKGLFNKSEQEMSAQA